MTNKKKTENKQNDSEVDEIKKVINKRDLQNKVLKKLIDDIKPNTNKENK